MYSVLSFEPTYEELKPREWALRYWAAHCFEPTYEELKHLL